MQSEPSQNTRTDDEAHTGNGPRCPDCNGNNLDKSVENIDAVCNGCGYVIHDFANPAEFLEIGSIERAERISSEENRKQDPQRNWTDVYTAITGTEQRIATAYESLEELADILTLSIEVRKRTATAIATAAEENLIAGRSLESVVGALVYVTAREIGTPRPLTLVAENIERETRDLERLVRSLHLELDLEHQGCHPEEYLPYLCRELGYTEDVEHQAREWINDAQRVGLTNGKSPTGCAGAALYLASNGEQSQRTVAVTVGVSKETIRLRIKEFRSKLLSDEQV